MTATKNREGEYLWEMAYKEGVNSDFFANQLLAMQDSETDSYT